MNQNQEALNIATNMANIIGSCNVTIAKLQVENEQLKIRNAKLQEALDSQRKEDTNVTGNDYATNKQVGYSGKQ
ncbi:hypothetical protein [Lactobacillus sp. LL6]|uniref:hypothetical protein n=1 Tax=Lactobacillus sp. LL6 TaxID=2596827 RepID=UPI0011870C03|nr:hypothetical protein [Lactobacillus sp. LL6]TSO25284.1 hypothetical protein FOD82_08575 [Lactobacillus sp. LL6]